MSYIDSELSKNRAILVANVAPRAMLDYIHHEIDNNPCASVGIIAPSLRDSKVLLNNLKYGYQYANAITKNNKTKFELSNYSDVYCWGSSGNIARGYALNLTYIDSAKDINPKALDWLLNCILPSLWGWSNTRLVVNWGEDPYLREWRKRHHLYMNASSLFKKLH